MNKNGVNCLQLTPFGCGDPQRTNYAPFYGRFEEIGLLEVEAVFGWLQEFGLDVLLGIDRKFIYFFNMSYKVSNLH